MNLNTFFEHLDQVEELTFVLPNGTYVPPHFHLTEVALVSKKFVDCGGTMRDENVISFQLWSADDYDHRLAPLPGLWNCGTCPGSTRLWKP